MRGFATSPHSTNYFEDETMTTTPTASPELPGLGYLQFRKKPVVIEAIQWPGCRFLDAPPQWFIDAMHKTPGESGFLMRIGDDIFIETLEGRMRAEPGDWIIRGIKGEIYPCKPEIFEASYERADRAQPEGEAPQAEPVASVTDKYSRGGYNDEIDVLLRVGTKLYAHPPAAILSPLCGAQHAESGKESIRQHEAIEASVDQWYPKRDSPHASVNDKIGAARLAFRKGYRAALAAQQAAAPGPAHGTIVREGDNLVCTACGTSDPGTPEAPKPPFPISDDEMAALRRFWECATDGEGYDVEKAMMQRLAEMGLVQRKSGAYYMATDFGLYVLGEYTIQRAAQLDGGQEGSGS